MSNNKIKLVVEVDEYCRDAIIRHINGTYGAQLPYYIISSAFGAIANGTPITEGDLIMFRTLMTEIANKGLPFEEVLLLIDNAKTPTEGDCISCEAINSEIEKRYCSKHCVVPYEVPYCPDNCPARLLKNIVKECPSVPERDYSQGWHDAIAKALNEAYTITTEDGSFKVVQTETLEGLGMSMPDKKGGADNEKNDK